MKLKKLLILLLTILMIDLPAYKTDASNGNDMIALDNFESYGKTLSSPWASQGARSTGELSETQYGKSAILSSTSSAMHELIRSFSKTPAHIKGNLLAFSMLFEDFSANRHVLIRRDGSSDDIYISISLKLLRSWMIFPLYHSSPNLPHPRRFWRPAHPSYVFKLLNVTQFEITGTNK